MLRYKAWHKSQQVLESATDQILRLLKYFHSSIFGGFIGFTKDSSNGLIK